VSTKPSNSFGAAVAFQQAGKLGEAERLYSRILKSEPTHFDARHLLGIVRHQQGRLAEALELLAGALRIHPNAAPALLNYAIILKKLGKFDDALVSYNRALAIQPDFAEAWHYRGNVLHELGRHDEALKNYDLAVAIRPAYVDAYNSRAIFMTHGGRFGEAQLCVERSLLMDRRNTKSYHILTQTKRFMPEDTAIARMRELSHDTSGMAEGNQIQLCFALSKALADIGNHEEAFEYLVRGNALKRRHVTYNEAETLRYLRRIEAGFTRDFMDAKHGSGIASNLPVFIVGMPRSGTTLIEQIIASHPQVLGAGELKTFGTLVTNLGNDAGVALPFPELVTEISATQLRRLGEAYVNSIRGLAPGAARIVDKMPANFQAVGLIHLAIPNARIIHARRDPRDTALSCFSILFDEGQQPHCYDLKELGRYYRAYDGLIDHWRKVLPPGVMLEVRYEEVVADLEGQARRVVAHCDLEWNESCIAFHKRNQPVWTASAMQVRQPIYSTSIARWRRYERQLPPLLEALETPRVELSDIHQNTPEPDAILGAAEVKALQGANRVGRHWP
jgi:tetratricopeptide (TPR) repeat protein